MTTPILGLQELISGQSQPEVVVNAALRVLEAVSPLVVISQTTSAPPGSPAEGDRYIVPTDGSGAWLGHGFQIALFSNTAWVFITPLTGWTAYDQETDSYLKYTPGSPSGWVAWP